MRAFWSLLVLLVLLPVASAQAAPPTCTSFFPPAEDDGRPTRGSVGCQGALDVPLTLTLVKPPAHGTLTDFQDRTWPWGSASELPQYTPTAGFRGPDSFTVRATVAGESVEHNVALTVVDPVDDPPRCTLHWTNVMSGLERAPLDAGETAYGNVTCGDDEGAALEITVAQAPAHGALSALKPLMVFQGVSFTYVPALAYRGPDEFTLRATDGTHVTDTVLKVTVIAPTNAAPMCHGLPYFGPTGPNGHPRVQAGKPIELLFPCGDPEAAKLGFAVLKAPAHGTATLAQPETARAVITYTPDPAYRGVDELTVRMTDGPHVFDRTFRLDVVEPDPAPEPEPETPREEPRVTTPTTTAVPAVVVGPHVKPVSSLDLRIEKACGKLKHTRRATCARRERALAKCAKMKQQRAAKAACVKRAKAIGKPKRR